MCLKELIFTTFTYELRYIYSLTISQYTLTDLIPLFKGNLLNWWKWVMEIKVFVCQQDYCLLNLSPN